MAEHLQLFYRQWSQNLERKETFSLWVEVWGAFCSAPHLILEAVHPSIYSLSAPQVWNVYPLAQSPPLSPLGTLMSSKVLVCEFHIPLELEIPICPVLCFGFISPAWATGLHPFQDENQDCYSAVFHPCSNTGVPWKFFKSSCPDLPSGEGLVNPKFAQQYVRNVGHHIQTTLWLFFLGCWSEFRWDSWKIRISLIECLFEIILVLSAAGFRSQESCQHL